MIPMLEVTKHASRLLCLMALRSHIREVSLCLCGVVVFLFPLFCGFLLNK